ncbi:MAG TPA: glycosyltransferase [Candidatus Saccharimonadales bacterium]|nr:glycosyltransferase [Candidatus Saccharimonadales bacterium]
MKNPLLTVCIITYNHERYIRECLDTVLMQQLSVPWQIVIADDCSTDGTRKVLQEYKSKYPDLIHLILQEKNVGPERNWLDLIAYPTSKYLLYTEGDDFMLDPTKLQRQVDFLEAHHDFSICFHPVKVMYEGSTRTDEIFPTPAQRFQKRVLGPKDLLKSNFIQTNSVMYRWRFGKQNVREAFPPGVIPGDWYLHLLHAQVGKIGFMDRVMSVYRRHPGGLWWNQHSNPALIWEKHGRGFLKLLHAIMLLYGKDADNKRTIQGHIAGSYEAITAIKPQQVADDVAIQSISDIPAETWDYIKDLVQQIAGGAEREARLRTLVEQGARTNLLLSDDNKRLSGELKNIKSSKLWKALRVARFGSYSARHPVQGAKQAVRHLGAKTKRR